MAASELRIALAGATGAVGRAVLEVLEEHAVPLAEVRALATARSAGVELPFRGDDLAVEAVGEASFRGCHLAILAVPAAAAPELAEAARRSGALVVDGSGAFGGDPEVPLVVPEVNREAAERLPRGIAASPCGLAVALALVLKPLRDAAGLARCAALGLESASAAGRRGIEQLEGEAQALMNGREPDPPAALPHRLAFNLVPAAGAPLPGGVFEAEARLASEVRRVLGAADLPLQATVLRVPVFYGHLAVVSLRTARRLGTVEAREILRRAEGLKLIDQPGEQVYPMPMLGVNDDAVLVGRVREDPTQENGLELVLALDNLRKGGATNLVQLAQLLAARHLRRE